MPTQPEPIASPRHPLSRERVMRTAVGIADEGRLESLSMRKLARALGVEAMSLYNHVANKDDLLDGIVDIVIGEIDVPSSGDEWKAAMRRRAISAREMLSRHPWAAGLIESRTNSSPARMRYPDAVMGNLLDAGFSIEMTIHAFFTLDSYIYGFALQEKNLPSGTPEQLAGMAELAMREIPAGEYPHLRRVIVDHVLKVGFDYADEFEFGLDLILDGLERIRDAT
jgi:AcrR family transcriptional regulator